MHTYKSIRINDEDILNLKHCLERVFDKDFKRPEWHIDFWPLTIQHIIDEWGKAEIDENYEPKFDQGGWE